jgi:prephenate dehydrogenase
VFCQKIALMGVGLLGGSLGLALKQRKLAGQVAGYVRRPTSVEECSRLGAVDQATMDLAEAVHGAEVVVLCTPLAQMRGLVDRMLPALIPGAIVTDVGSVKAGIVSELEPVLARAGGHFLGSHPMAGAEKMGVSHARPDLFENAICILTPTPSSSSEALRRVRELWRSVGGRTIRLTPEVHDELVSRSSHLPHVVAAELANYVLSPAHPKVQAALCANGFRDSTRIASGSPEMWRDIAVANRLNLLRVLRVFIEDLQEFQVALENGDVRAVSDFFEKAKQRRDAWCAQTDSPE